MIDHDQSFDRFWSLVKIQRTVFTLGWGLFLLAYLGIGIGALVLLFLIEAQFFRQITHDPQVSYIVAGMLEAAKVGTSVIKQALGMAKKVSRVRVSALLQVCTAIFQLALIVVSLICCVMVVTWYLDGTYEGTLVASAKSGPHPIVTTALRIVREGFGVEIKASVCISGFALLMSALFQSTMYIVFGHLLATQSHEVEHLFTVKQQKTDAKKNSMSSR